MDSERLTPYLRRRVLALRTEDRVALLGVLRESLTDSPRTERDRGHRMAELARVMERLTGLEVCTRTRRRDYVRARDVFAFTARQEGISQKAVGAFLGLDHSSVNRCEARMKTAFSVPAAWGDYVSLYNKFTEAIL